MVAGGRPYREAWLEIIFFFLKKTTQASKLGFLKEMYLVGTGSMGKEVAEKYVQGQGGGQWEESRKLQSRSITEVKGSEGTSWERNLKS